MLVLYLPFTPSPSPLLTKEGKINDHKEQVPWLALIPVLATGLFYLLPLGFQHNRLIQFFPQMLSYMALGIWLKHNTGLKERLGFLVQDLPRGITWGCATGMVLGMINTLVILWGVPAIGGDIIFLKETPHAKMPTLLMVPWGILAIAVGVELNFRGFILGRLETVFGHWTRGRQVGTMEVSSILAIVISAVVFAFDPFMVATFRHLHWIAIGDGLIWGWLLVRLRYLYAVIVAHAVEVVIMYLSIKAALT